MLWALVVFFGASIMFGAIGNATEDEGAGVRLLAQVGAGGLLVGAIVLYIQRRR